MVERCFILHIDGGRSRRRGAVETRRLMRGDGLVQEEEAVWRHGGVDGREAWQGWCFSSALRMDRGVMEVTALATCGAHREYARSVWDPIQVVAWMGHPALDVRLWCDVCLVLGPDIWHAFIKRIGVATVLPRWWLQAY